MVTIGLVGLLAMLALGMAVSAANAGDPVGKESKGIEALNATIDAAEGLGIEVARVAKDGLQFTDGPTLMAHLATNRDLQAKLYRAYVLSANVGAEAKDLDNKEKRALTHRMVDVGYNIHDELLAE